MRRTTRKSEPSRVIAPTRMRVGPDLELIWHQNEVGTGAGGVWHAMQADVCTEDGQQLAKLDVCNGRYRIFACGLSDWDRRRLTSKLAAFDLEEYQ